MYLWLILFCISFSTFAATNGITDNESINLVGYTVGPLEFEINGKQHSVKSQVIVGWANDQAQSDVITDWFRNEIHRSIKENPNAIFSAAALYNPKQLDQRSLLEENARKIIRPNDEIKSLPVNFDDGRNPSNEDEYQKYLKSGKKNNRKFIFIRTIANGTVSTLSFLTGNFTHLQAFVLGSELGMLSGLSQYYVGIISKFIDSKSIRTALLKLHGLERFDSKVMAANIKRPTGSQKYIIRAIDAITFSWVQMKYFMVELTFVAAIESVRGLLGWFPEDINFIHDLVATNVSRAMLATSSQGLLMTGVYKQLNPLIDKAVKDGNYKLAAKYRTLLQKIECSGSLTYAAAMAASIAQLPTEAIFFGAMAIAGVSNHLRLIFDKNNVVGKLFNKAYSACSRALAPISKVFNFEHI